MAKKPKQTEAWSFKSMRIRVEDLEVRVGELEKQVAKFTTPSWLKRVFGKQAEIKAETQGEQ